MENQETILAPQQETAPAPQQVTASVPQLLPGEWRHPTVTDLRSPCPVLNSLANHGYISRDGRNITSDEVIKAFQEVLGLALDTAMSLAKPAFLLHLDQEPSNKNDKALESETKKEEQSWFHSFLSKLPGLPTMDSQLRVGLRNAGQVNEKGEPVLNLDQLSRHGAIEHDVSLTRNDFEQGDNTSIQPHLVEQLLKASSDGNVLTISDFAHLRNVRLAQQRKDNPKLKFDTREAILAFGEVALIMCVWGVSMSGGYDKAPCKYVEVLFKEERFPFQEGWKRRTIPVTLAELTANSTYLQAAAFLDSFHH
ncbi:Chloroperoxidase [Dactylellina cionopaga]|nr:Chloroperoxidase [Dactylellina cionopaga]